MLTTSGFTKINFEKDNEQGWFGALKATDGLNVDLMEGEVFANCAYLLAKHEVLSLPPWRLIGSVLQSGPGTSTSLQ